MSFLENLLTLKPEYEKLNVRNSFLEKFLGNKANEYRLHETEAGLYVVLPYDKKNNLHIPKNLKKVDSGTYRTSWQERFPLKENFHLISNSVSKQNELNFYTSTVVKNFGSIREEDNRFFGFTITHDVSESLEIVSLTLQYYYGSGKSGYYSQFFISVDPLTKEAKATGNIVFPEGYLDRFLINNNLMADSESEELILEKIDFENSIANLVYLIKKKDISNAEIESIIIGDYIFLKHPKEERNNYIH